MSMRMCEIQYAKDGKSLHTVGAVQDITESMLAQKHEEERDLQQNFVATLGKQAIAGPDIDTIFNQAVTGIANILAADYTAILELAPGDEKLLLRAGAGWEAGMVGKAMVSAGSASPAGYALQQKQTVVVKDLAGESRFTEPQLSKDHGITSSVSVVIEGPGKPYGVLGVHTRKRRDFHQYEIDFIQAVANILAETINRHRSSRIILQSREKLFHMRQSLQEIREEERMKISREIHDVLGQRITALKMDLSWLSGHLPGNGGNLSERMNAAIVLTDSILDFSRKLALELRPPILDDLGLEPAIEWEVQQFSKRTNCIYTLFLQAGGCKLDRDRTVTVFRILQEALTNITRHAHATHVDITLKSDADILQLIISDNGIGVQTDHLTSMDSLGFTGMRERAGAMGGKISIDNGKHGGTTIVLEMPIKQFHP